MSQFKVYRIRRKRKTGMPTRRYARISFGRGVTASDPVIWPDDTIQAKTAHEDSVLDRYRRNGTLEVVPESEPEKDIGYEMGDDTGDDAETD